MLQKNYKICLVSDCLSDGGAERVAASLSDFFFFKNIDVQHVIVQDDVKYAFSGTVYVYYTLTIVGSILKRTGTGVRQYLYGTLVR